MAFTEREMKAIYNRATDWLSITFKQKPSREILTGLKSHGFRWKPYRKSWIAKWSTDREKKLKQLVGSIDVINRSVDYTKKAEIMQMRAGKHEQKAKEHDKTFSGLMRAIPLGQPILVGHHSEKRHRRDLARMEQHLKKTVEESEIAKNYAEKAQRYQQIATHGESPVLLHRRIQRLEAEERKWESEMVFVKLGKKKGVETLRKMGVHPANEEWVTKNLKHTQERLEIERAKYKTSGGIPTDKMVLQKGDVVETSFGVAKILKVNPKTVRVRFVDKRHAGFQEMKLDKTRIRGKS